MSLVSLIYFLLVGIRRKRTALGNLDLLGVGHGRSSLGYALGDLRVDLDAGLEIAVNGQLLATLVSGGSGVLWTLGQRDTHMMIGLNQK